MSNSKLKVSEEMTPSSRSWKPWSLLFWWRGSLDNGPQTQLLLIYLVGPWQVIYHFIYHFVRNMVGDEQIHFVDFVGDFGANSITYKILDKIIRNSWFIITVEPEKKKRWKEDFYIDILAKDEPPFPSVTWKFKLPKQF